MRARALSQVVFVTRYPMSPSSHLKTYPLSGQAQLVSVRLTISESRDIKNHGSEQIRALATPI
jgi:hypothetical protein